MFTGAWKALVEIIYNTTGSLFVGVYLYALLTLMEIFSLSVIIMHIAEKIRTRKRKDMLLWERFIMRKATREYILISLWQDEQ